MSTVADDANVPRRLGRYEVIGFLASGGMAEILLGRFLGPDGFERPIVLKRILPHLAREASFVQMFLDEARIIARIRHPNVVQVHELAREGAELFMVMEYLEGESAAGLMRRLTNKGEQLDPVLAAHVVASACGGLHAAHQLTDEDDRALAIVHRDVSPHNVFVGFDGTVKVLDFGIAKSVQQTSRTETGQVKGKFAYMSPEQALAHTLDLRSDVFAVSVVLYELLTGRKLFHRGTPLATLKAITAGPIVPPSRLNPACPEALERICLRGLRRRPDERYQTADALRQDLLSAARALGAKGEPSDELAALMGRIFSDRKQEKAEMLRRVRAGSLVTDLPSPEADASVEVPIADDETDVEVSIAYAGARRRRWRVDGVAILLGLLATGAALVLGTRIGVHPPLGATALAASGAGVPPPSAPPLATNAPPSSAGPAPSALHASVHIQVETAPDGAEVLLDGRPSGTTPLDLQVDREEASHTIDIRKTGFSSLHDTVTPNLDQKLRFSLSPSPTSARRPHARGLPSAPVVVDPTSVKW